MQLWPRGFAVYSDELSTYRKSEECRAKCGNIAPNGYNKVRIRVRRLLRVPVPPAAPKYFRRNAR